MEHRWLTDGAQVDGRRNRKGFASGMETLRSLLRRLTLLTVALTLCAPVARAQQQMAACAFNAVHTGAACEVSPSGVSTALEGGHLGRVYS
jgi:hypothetical protein